MKTSRIDSLTPRTLFKGQSSKVASIISPKPPSIFGTVREVWEHRELLYTFAWRDITVRYKQTVVGVAWVVIQPLMMMLVFSIFLGFLVRVPSDGIPYPLFVYSGLVIWQVFARTLMLSGTSIKDNEVVISRVYFPRIILPLAVIFGGLLDFLVSLVAVIPLMVFYGAYPSLSVLFAPLFVAVAVLAAFSFGLWLSAVDAKYRDVRQTLPVLLQFWMFMTPVVYPTSVVPEQWQAIYGLNPMVAAVEGLRWSLIDGAPRPDLTVMTISILALLFLLMGGLVYFRRVEGTMVDTI